eukprot:gene1710-1061_t
MLSNAFQATKEQVSSRVGQINMEVSYKGYVNKLNNTGKSHSWKKRFLQIQDGHLVMSENETDTEGKALNLEQVQSVCPVPSSTARRPFVFALNTISGKSMWFEAVSVQSMEEWIDTIHRAIGLEKGTLSYLLAFPLVNLERCLSGKHLPRVASFQFSNSVAAGVTFFWVTHSIFILLSYCYLMFIVCIIVFVIIHGSVSLSFQATKEPVNNRIGQINMEVSYKGYVNKLNNTGKSHSWKKRFLQIQNGHLVMSVNETDTEGKALNLEQVQSVCPVPSSTARRPFVFALNTMSGQSMWFEAVSVQSMEEWIDTIHRAIGLEKGTLSYLLAFPLVNLLLPGQGPSTFQATKEPVNNRIGQINMEVSYKGYVNKLNNTGKSHSWKKRFLQIQNGHLVMSVNETDTEGKALNLEQVQSVCPVPSSTARRPFVFALNTMSGQSMWFEAVSVQSMEEWIDTIHRAIGLEKGTLSYLLAFPLVNLEKDVWSGKHLPRVASWPRAFQFSNSVAAGVTFFWVTHSIFYSPFLLLLNVYRMTYFLSGVLFYLALVVRRIMSFGDGGILGFNNPASFAVVDGRLFIPAGNGVIISQNEEFHLWQPTRGQYEITHVTSNSKGMLCLAEKKLSVSLHFFHGADLRHLNELPDVATAVVDTMCFSYDSECLFVLCSTPSSFVKIIKAVNGKFSQTTTVHCGGTFNALVIPANFTNCTRDFIVVHTRGFSGFSSNAGDYAECISSTDMGENVSCGVALTGGVLLGSTNGEIFNYNHEKRACIDQRTLENEAGITSMCIVNATPYVGTGSGKIFKYDLLGDFSLVVDVGSSIRHIYYPGSGSTCYVGADNGIYQLELSESAGLLFTVKMKSAAVVKCMRYTDNQFVSACKDGSLCVVTVDAGSTTYWKGSAAVNVLDACLLDSGNVVLGLSTGDVQCFNLSTGRLSWTASYANFKASFCESNLKDKIIVAHKSSLRLVSVSAEGFDTVGMFRISSSSAIAVVHWIPGESRFLVAFKNGEIHLFRFPDSTFEPDVEYGSETILESIWRLDFPLVDFVPLYSEPDVVNILVHSVDKDTKLYALERKRDGDNKLLRPLFLMRDHESGGACLTRFNETTILSGGKDGRVILRDVEHYQTKLSAIPPSKEKRKPIFDSVARQFTGGGATTTCVVAGLIVCGGADAVLTIIPTTDRGQLHWREKAWACRQYSAGPVQVQETIDGDVSAITSTREQLLSDMKELRDEWRSVMHSMDVEVPVDALLMPEKQIEFNEECEKSIEQMKEDNYYHMLLNQYVQFTIRRNCWDTMAVIRQKVVSLTDTSVEVHNFHLLKEVTRREAVAKKILFLRNLQNKVGTGHRVLPLRTAASPTPRTKLLPEDDYKTALFSPFDVYTHTRAVMQSILFQGRILFLKIAFNRTFNELKEKKKSAINQIEERTKRCVKISKQLGEQPGDFFAATEDPEEDPLTIFDVKDEELDEDVRKLVVKKSEVTIVSPSNEAALHLWMDGLEKDVELLQVNLPPPDFADESKESFIPPEERTEEQAKAFEDYEKKLKEEIEMINVKKDGLRNEFKLLQKTNKECAAAVDETLKQLRHCRLVTAEEINECEMQLVNLLQQLLRSPGAFRRFEMFDSEKMRLEKMLKHVGILLKGKREVYAQFQNHLNALEDQNEMMIDDVKQDPPFSDGGVGDKLHRRFARWKRKFDEGKMKLEDVKKPDDISDAVWDAYYRHCEAAVALRDELARATLEKKQEEEALAIMDEEYLSIRKAIAGKEDLKNSERSSYLKNILNTSSLYSLNQGQVQDETATVSADFASSCLRWVQDVQQYNDLIFASDAENANFLERIIHRRKVMKFLRWETERLNYCIGTFEVELRQLHTLRVTRQMQEWLSGDSEMSEEKVIESIERHIKYVNQKMSKKVQDLSAVTVRMKSQIGERTTENSMIHKQSEELKDSVEDKKSVKNLVDVHADGSLQFSQRAKEIYETSELEELARDQQEELIRLKREVDRLRERTFPSFAVVSKRTV